MIVEKRKLSELREMEGNPRRITDAQLQALERSMDRFGYVEPIVWNRRTGHVISGHQRLKVLRAKGVQEAEAVVVDFDEVQEKALNVAMNKISGDWDEEKLIQIMNTIRKEDETLLSYTGFDEPELSKMMNSLKEVQEDEFEIPKEPKYKIEKGEVWKIGQHRLMCGDATIKEDVETLMDGQKADMIFTDPPYGINIVNSSNADITAKIGFGKVGTMGVVPAREYRQIKGDDKPFDPAFLLQLAPKMILWGANNYASKLKDNAQWLVWDKKCEQGADHNNFSDCELAYTNINAKSVRIYRYLWSGLLRQGNRDVELNERVHPTQKPVGLNSEILKDYSKDNELILDLFGGSGSTLIACEQTNRKCFMMEIDPFYCSVIIERWEKLTEKIAEKVN